MYQYQYKKEKSPKIIRNTIMSGVFFFFVLFCFFVFFFFRYGLKKEFEVAVVNEPSVLEPLKLYCIFYFQYTCIRPTRLILFSFQNMATGHVG